MRSSWGGKTAVTKRRISHSDGFIKQRREGGRGKDVPRSLE